MLEVKLDKKKRVQIPVGQVVSVESKIINLTYT